MVFHISLVCVILIVSEILTDVKRESAVYVRTTFQIATTSTTAERANLSGSGRSRVHRFLCTWVYQRDCRRDRCEGGLYQRSDLYAFCDEGCDVLSSVRSLLCRPPWRECRTVVLTRCGEES